MTKLAVTGQRHKKASVSEGALTDVPGLTVGHAHDLRAMTGCTVVMFGESGAVAGVDVRGGAPGTRETDLLNPENLVERAHAILLTGGSVFGLDAACGVVSYLEERGVGFQTAAGRVPIVPAAVIYDLAVGDSSVRPGSKMGYQACTHANKGAVVEGRVGAGAGATAGKIGGHELASPGGVGTTSLKLTNGVTVGALVVVNSLGDIVDPRTGKILAGARNPRGKGWLDSSRAVMELDSAASRPALENTTLAVVATDAALTKAEARKVAAMAHDGMARAIRPAHTMFDGDTVFAVSTGVVKADVSVIGTAAAEAVAAAIARVGRLAAALRPRRPRS
jgi:L-aminopeptidase/D-esterase-like protein